MPDRLYELHGARILECGAEGNRLRSDGDAVALIGVAWEQRAAWLVIPVERLDDDFFSLKTGIAGTIIQKFVTYRLRVAIVGDISRYLAESSALRQFVYESNQGEQVWFVANSEEFEQRLDRA
jgi:hypothetical protein